MEAKVLIFHLLQMLLLAGAVSAKQPHILFVLADDYGWNDIGYHGSEIKTPTLDKLASEGVKLENYYVQPICTPTRSQLMSGRYQIHTGLQHSIIWSSQPSCLPLSDPTMADRLSDAGYSTRIVGKWHLGFWKTDCTPTRRGFDSFFGYLTGSEDYYTHRRCYSASVPPEYSETAAGKPAKAPCGLDLHSDEVPVDQYSGEYSAELFARKAEEIIREHGEKNEDKPLFLYLPFQSVHAPLQVPERYTKQYDIKDHNRRTYAGMVSALDEAVKNVTEAFKAAGLWDDTVMVFSTDNGGQILEGGNNWPLRGWKGSLWEGGMHGNGFVVSNRLKSTRGEKLEELVHVSDWFPTLVALGGGNVSGLSLDGHDMWATISEGAPSPRRELLHNIDPLYPPSGRPYPGSPFDSRVRAAIRVGDWKLITGNPGNSSWIPPPGVDRRPLNTVTSDDDLDRVLRFRPLVRDSFDPAYVPTPTSPASKNLWLFNVKQDPEERRDLSADNPDKVMELLQRLAYYNSTAIPAYYPPADPQSNPALHGNVWQPWYTGQ